MLEQLLAVGGRWYPRREHPGRRLGGRFDGDPNIVDVYISHLRRKLDRLRGHGVLTVHGLGYRLAADGG